MDGPAEALLLGETGELELGSRSIGARLRVCSFRAAQLEKRLGVRHPLLQFSGAVGKFRLRGRTSLHSPI